LGIQKLHGLFSSKLCNLQKSHFIYYYTQPDLSSDNTFTKNDKF